MEASLRREAVSDGPNGDSCAAVCRAGSSRRSDYYSQQPRQYQ